NTTKMTMDLFPPALLLKLTFCAYGIGILGSLLALRRERLANALGFGSAIVASVCGIGAAISHLVSGSAANSAPFELWPSLIPYLKLGVKLDPLGAFFLVIVSGLGLALSIYSLGYVRGFCGRKSVGILAAFYNALLLATTLVFTADRKSVV